jgi:hypothetical protein
MLDRRQNSRSLTLKTGKIRSWDAASDVDCAILNISETGACILVPASAAIPDVFRLAVDFDPNAYACKVVWRSGNRIGVSFAPSGGD